MNCLQVLHLPPKWVISFLKVSCGLTLDSSFHAVFASHLFMVLLWGRVVLLDVGRAIPWGTL